MRRILWILVWAILLLVPSALFALSKQGEESQNTMFLSFQSNLEAKDTEEWGGVVERGSLVKAGKLFHTSPPYLQSASTAYVEVDGVPVALQQVRDERNAEDNHAWFGRADGARDLSHIRFLGESMAGSIALADGTYRLIVTREKRQYMLKMDDLQIGLLLAGDQDFEPIFFPLLQAREMEARSRIPRVVSPRGCGPGQIMAQVLDQIYGYDTTAKDFYGAGRGNDSAKEELETTLWAAQDYTNATLENSGYPEFRVQLVSIIELDYTADDKLGDSVAFAVDSEQFADAKRAYPNASIGVVVGTMWTPDDYLAGREAGGYRPHGTSGRAYQAVRVAGGLQVFAHEWGHGPDLHHQKEDPGTPQNEAPYYGKVWPGKGRDNMTIPLPGMCTDCPMRQVYSSQRGPDPLGDPEADNASALPVAFPVMGATSACVDRAVN